MIQLFLLRLHQLMIADASLLVCVTVIQHDTILQDVSIISPQVRKLPLTSSHMQILSRLTLHISSILLSMVDTAELTRVIVENQFTSKKMDGLSTGMVKLGCLTILNKREEQWVKSSVQPTDTQSTGFIGSMSTLTEQTSLKFLT
jgi:hypothetical protein